MMTIFTLFFSACSGKLKKLNIISLASGQEYTLPLKADNIISGGDFRTFDIKNNISEINDILTQKGYDSAVYNNNFILIKNNIDENKTDYLVIGKLRGQNHYQFMSAVFAAGNGEYYLFPIHLTTKKSTDLDAGEVYFFETLKDIPFAVTLADLKTFYTAAGIFNIEEEDNSLKISVKPNAFVHKLSKETFYVSLRTDGEQTFIDLKTEEK